MDALQEQASLSCGGFWILRFAAVPTEKSKIFFASEAQEVEDELQMSGYLTLHEEPDSSPAGSKLTKEEVKGTNNLRLLELQKQKNTFAVTVPEFKARSTKGANLILSL
jgi:hypothetical protein